MFPNPKTPENIIRRRCASHLTTPNVDTILGVIPNFNFLLAQKQRFIKPSYSVHWVKPGTVD